jgi:DNA-binding HxlR family transcriptional regulator
MSRTILAGLLPGDESGAYLLTGLGADLIAALAPLDAWARRWAVALEGQEPG